MTMQVRADDPLFQLEGAPPAITSTAVIPAQGTAERSLILNGASTPMMVINGKQIGEGVASIMRVAVAQLRLADDVRLRRGYSPDDDTAFPALLESIRQTRINVEPLLCEVTQETVQVEGEDLPVLIVRSGERRLHALLRLHLPWAQVRLIPQDANEGVTLLLSLIVNEMRAPLQILDKCDIVAMLVGDYHMRQHVVASYTGYSQSYVSRLNMGASQPPIIRTYLANSSLSLEVLEALNKRFKDDPDLRALAARYVVQESLENGHVADFLNAIAPPAGMQPTARLDQSETGEVLLLPTNGERPLPRPGTALQLVAEKPYWKRGFPLRAMPTRILEHHHPVELVGGPEDAEVKLASLHISQLFELLRRERAATVDIAALEEAFLSDLEAIRQGLVRLQFATPKAGGQSG